MPGLSKFTVSNFAVKTFFNSVSKIQTLDTKTRKCCWHRPHQTRKRISLGTYLLKQDSWGTEILPFCEERVKVVKSTKCEPCFVLFSIDSSLVKIYLPRLQGNCNYIRSNWPYRPMTASSLRGWSQSDDSCVTLLLYKKSKEEISFSTSQWSRPWISLPHWRSVL